MKPNTILEKLADLEHEQWIEWSKSVAPEVSETRKERWKKYWIPYSDLTEEVKDQDRKYAKKVLKILEEHFESLKTMAPK